MNNAAKSSLEAHRWNAVRTRSLPAADPFVFAVRTTGVYCRPTCRSRLPRRENVRFFPTPLEAERAGYRPCKRCTPQLADASAPHRDAILRACRELDAAAAPPALRELAASAGLSPFHFQRVFKKLVGVSPKQYGAARRAERLRASLRRSVRQGQSVTGAICAADIACGSGAQRIAAESLGMSPGAFRAGGAGATIGYAIVSTDLGPLLVAATGKGVCSIEFGDSASALRALIREQYPSATLHEGGRRIAALARRAARLVASPTTDAAAHLTLPLDIQGTAFQRRVWRALQHVPTGKTTTYAALAKAVGAPRSVRAVAQACAANPVAVAVPCHRAIGADGALRGYRWGVERKARLLRRERSM
ncbi:Bifunctional transcriptional activator/DNA repair enzyme Ada [Phycisphaerae bacterium RAS1]|nr:Bifunctional transcriptional activator/DNA repair enzyme Ada [Phycisphaerae bacterium RAS1]